MFRSGPDHTYWFATERAKEGRVAPQGELEYLKTRFGSWAEPLPTLLAATDPDVVLRNDLYDRDEARRLVEGPDRAGRRRRPPDAPASGPGRLPRAGGRRDPGRTSSTRAAICRRAFARFATFRKPRGEALVRESAMIGKVVNLRPGVLSAAASRATVLVPEAVLTRHLATVASRSAFSVRRRRRQPRPNGLRNVEQS